MCEQHATLETTAVLIWTCVLAVLVRMVGHVLTMVMPTTAIVLLVYLTTSILTVLVSAQSKLHTVARRLYLQHCNLSTSVPSSLQAHRVCTINVRMALALLGWTGHMQLFLRLLWGLLPVLQDNCGW